MREDAGTIAAIVTAPGEAGVAIVRVSGPDALSIADRIFRCNGAPPSSRASHTVVHGAICDRDGERVDDVLLLIFRGPRSFTGEDVVEFQGHGGRCVVRRVLETVLAAGARVAGPGEFTRRAFLNGRLDLMQAEAVLDLVRAESDRASRAALEQLEGSLSRSVHAAFDTLMSLAADLEASLDFPEDELPEGVLADLSERIKKSQDVINKLLVTNREGRLLREGARVVIAGRPNAGKSSLMNGLLGRSRAIVSPEPGTTRDTIDESLVLGGVVVRLTDTAGLRETACMVEREGISRAETAVRNADLILYVVDASLPADPVDLERISALSRTTPTLLLLNKTDLGHTWHSVMKDKGSDLDVRTFETVLNRDQGLDAVRDAMTSFFTTDEGIPWTPTPHAVISARHQDLLERAGSGLKEAALLLHQGDQKLDLAAQSIRDAIDAIGHITGRVYEQELLDRIFSRFCIGK